ncbi:serine hydrolase [uncultured Massilia sp.]|uniref:serine hydrolase domain-containing protein n=1 Tax=uncultured Massilia sp. TaxID=169973 RepID=UPI0025F3B027|nr:serine hydrolase domain-containing protein [uncultured Massilia sp.]
MSTPRRLAAACLVPLAAIGCALQPAARGDGDPATRIAGGLRQRIAIEGEPVPTFDIQDRLRRYHVASVSIAVIRRGKIDWAGVHAVPAAGPVDTGTLYQAASISKGLTGVLAQRLARAGTLQLDTPVDACLAPWRLPAGRQDAAHPVTLRRLLDHTAGVTVSGFPGYPAAGPVASVTQILDGAPPSLTPAVEVRTVPGSAYAYSGGGYTVAQVALEHCAHAPFARLMQDEVLQPLGMRRSTFAQPLPAGEGNRARGHYADGSEVEGGARIYPELAAAGLWTTASDLARFAIGIRQAWQGASDFLTRDEASQFLRPGLDNYAQGVFVVGEGEHKRFMHSGGNAGFKSTYAMYLQEGDGVVVLTDGDNGSYLGGEIVKAVAAAYGWPDFKPRGVRRGVLDATVAARYAGAWRLDRFEGRFANRYELRAEGDGWVLVMPDIGPTRLVPTGSRTLVAPETGEEVELATRDGQDVVLIGARTAHRIAAAH